MSSVVLLVTLNIVEGQMDAYLTLARAHRGRVLDNEADCLRFDISKPDDGENIVHLYEVYKDEEAFKHHLETPYMKAYMEDTDLMIDSRNRVKATLHNE